MDEGPVPFDAGQLSSPNREAMIVREIRFSHGVPTDKVATIIAQDLHMGRELKVSMSVGPHKITASATDGIRPYLMAPLYDQLMENPAYTGSFRWRLAKPMFIPPGYSLMISARREMVAGVVSTFGTSYSTAKVPVVCTLIGNIVAGDFPKVTTVPWISDFAPTPVAPDAITGLGTDFASNQLHLQNDLLEAIELEYAVGRLSALYPAPAGLMAGCEYTVEDAGGIGTTAPCQMVLNGVDIIPPGTEFNMAFDYARRSLSLESLVLDSGKRIAFRMKMPYNDAYVQGSSIPEYWAPAVSIVGSRKEPV
jgi:hypothetical protein